MNVANREAGMLRLWWLMVACFVLGACSLPAVRMSVSSAQVECERGYGVWREVLSFCEYRSGC